MDLYLQSGILLPNRAEEGLMNPIRRGAAWLYRVLIALFATAVVVEFFLAGLGIFRAMPEEEPVSHETFTDDFAAHAGLGWSLVLGSLLLLIVILVAWTGIRSIGATFGLAVLTVVQTILAGVGEDTPVVGALHVINALLIMGLSWFLTARAWRGNLLIPPSQLYIAPIARPAPNGTQSPTPGG
jgi:hypothetical protein